MTRAAEQATTQHLAALWSTLASRAPPRRSLLSASELTLLRVPSFALAADVSCQLARFSSEKLNLSSELCCLCQRAIYASRLGLSQVSVCRYTGNKFYSDDWMHAH